jgi:hypothetical protein
MCPGREAGHSLPRSFEFKKGVMPSRHYLPLCDSINWSHDSFTLYVYWLLVIIFRGAQNILLNVSVVVHFDHLRFQDTERGCLLEFDGITS